MHELSDSLSQVFPDEEIRVNITNGYHVNVSFVNSDLKELERGKKEEIARKVGLITRHFFDKGRIYKGSLTFFVHEKGGIFEYTESTDTYDLWVLE
jgi:hypothetical protein